MPASIPIIDLSLAAGPEDPRERSLAVQAIADACSDWGAFQLVGHGLSDALIAEVWAQTERFFALPMADKRALSRSQENPRGYYDRELTKNVRDLKEVFDFHKERFPDLPGDHPDNRLAIDGYNQWPALLEFKHTMLAYFDACEALGGRLLELLCVGLGVPANHLHEQFGRDHTSFMRLNYYPVEDPLEPDQARTATPLSGMKLHHHTDAGALTILLQDDVGGLQVEARGTWHDVEPLAGALVINTGDMMQVWSNDRYHAPPHRVRPIEGRKRMSVPFFFNPSYATDCAPLAPLVRTEPPHYRTVNWGDFRKQRTDGDYADYGTEIQIEQFRTT